MEDIEERNRRGETRSFYRVPSQGKTAGSKRIAQAVDDEGWQEFRVSMKGKSTQVKLEMLCRYYTANVLDSFRTNTREDVEIRVDNYIKALCRGGQLYGGESLTTALENDWNLKIKS